MPGRQLEKIYDPTQVEERWYRFWTEKGYFHATVDRPGVPYSIVIPPPNITGSLHLGHALNNTLQDILIRWPRMQGRNTLWMPGTDHAGIATQNVVERQLLAEGTSREVLGREAFVKRVWDWKAQSGGSILQQLKRLGASCDWDRLRFTMDEGLSQAVREVFVRLHEDGLIYRGERLINWCPRCLTALSDIEVEHEETKGKLYHIEYPLADDPKTRLVVATTRPETMLGDTAVAVHPEDPRYNHLIGKKVRLPLTSRDIPIIGDPILVDREFGTGAVKIKPLAEPAIKAVEDGRIRLIPEGWVNNYLGWMRDIKDWCISRQIWWGHQIPAWYCRSCNEDAIIEAAPNAFTMTSDAKPIVARTAPAHCPDCSASDFIRDPDVLDTWFSSALWPFSTLGWPEQTPELKTYYPTSTLVTGLDILFFWVARKIMMGLKFTGNVPFRDVYIHALVRDAEGQKMSKSKGNVMDPLSVMEKYGTDALRFTLAAMASPGRDIKLAEERIEGYRNFANKIWNAARFILMNLDGPREAAPPKDRSFADRWILSRLNRTIRDVNASLEAYRFDQASSQLYHFIWHEYCDWYLELVKPSFQSKDSADAKRTRQTLVESFETLQRLLHPVMPFITEEIWQTLPHEGDSLLIQRYPVPIPEWNAKDIEAEFAVLEQFVTTVRTGRAQLNYQPGKVLALYGATSRGEQLTTLRHLLPFIEHLSRGSVKLAAVETWPTDKVLRLPVEGMTVGLDVEGEVDLEEVLSRLM